MGLLSELMHSVFTLDMAMIKVKAGYNLALPSESQFISVDGYYLVGIWKIYGMSTKLIRMVNEKNVIFCKKLLKKFVILYNILHV